MGWILVSWCDVMWCDALQQRWSSRNNLHRTLPDCSISKCSSRKRCCNHATCKNTDYIKCFAETEWRSETEVDFVNTKDGDNICQRTQRNVSANTKKKQLRLEHTVKSSEDTVVHWITQLFQRSLQSIELTYCNSSRKIIIKHENDVLNVFVASNSWKTVLTNQVIQANKDTTYSNLLCAIIWENWESSLQKLAPWNMWPKFTSFLVDMFG